MRFSLLSLSLALPVYARSDDHGFSPLHWVAKEGHSKLVETLLQRGARVNATNMGDDIPLHLAAAHGHRDVVQMVSSQYIPINATHIFSSICFDFILCSCFASARM